MIATRRWSCEPRRANHRADARPVTLVNFAGNAWPGELRPKLRSAVSTSFLSAQQALATPAVELPDKLSRRCILGSRREPPRWLRSDSMRTKMCLN